jgi:hypothetical protein
VFYIGSGSNTGAALGIGDSSLLAADVAIFGPYILTSPGAFITNGFSFELLTAGLDWQSCDTAVGAELGT